MGTAAASSTRSGAITTRAGVESIGVHVLDLSLALGVSTVSVACRRSSVQVRSPKTLGNGLCFRFAGECGLVGLREQCPTRMCRQHLVCFCLRRSSKVFLGTPGSVPWEFDEWWAAKRRCRHCTAPQMQL